MVTKDLAYSFRNIRMLSNTPLQTFDLMHSKRLLMESAYQVKQTSFRIRRLRVSHARQSRLAFEWRHLQVSSCSTVIAAAEKWRICSWVQACIQVTRPILAEAVVSWEYSRWWHWFRQTAGRSWKPRQWSAEACTSSWKGYSSKGW